MSNFGFGHWLFVAFVVYVIYRIFAKVKGPRRYCKTCGSAGISEVKTRGSIAIEIILWICFIVPGIIYSIWRLTTRAPVCGVCGSSEVVPEDTPAAIAARSGKP